MNKTKLVLAATVFLSACAVAPYNAVEHWEINNATTAVADHSLCGKVEMAPHARAINNYVQRLYRYSADLPKNDQVRTTLGLVRDSSTELAKRYEAEPYPSKRYCEDKLAVIEAMLVQARKQAAEKPNK